MIKAAAYCQSFCLLALFTNVTGGSTALVLYEICVLQWIRLIATHFKSVKELWDAATSLLCVHGDVGKKNPHNNRKMSIQCHNGKWELACQ